MTEKWEERVRLALEAATPGPWERDGSCWVVASGGGEDDFLMVADVSDGSNLGGPSEHSENVTKANVAAIVLLRNTADPLLDVVEAARALLVWQDPTPDGITGTCIFCAYPLDGIHDPLCKWEALGKRLARLDESKGES